MTIEREANKRPEVVRLMTHPGVGPITGVAYVLVMGTPDRLPCRSVVLDVAQQLAIFAVG